jgi:hypothetical protein
MKNEGGREAGKCSKFVPDHGDRCLFIFLWSSCLFCNVFPFPVCKAQLIGDWYENRRGALNTIIFLIMRQYYWRTDGFTSPIGWQDSSVRLVYFQANRLLAEGNIGAPINWRTNAPAPLLLADRWFHFSYLLIEQFGAPRLFSSQSPINWELQTGNGNTLKKRRRSH